MKQSARELWFAFAAILAITVLYLYVALTMGGIPAASSFFGHSLGVIGFLLMLMTETLYSRRKRSRRAKWGKMSNWLQFHIFTGLVGPYLVFLHSSFKFNGLAGVVLLLTGIVVLSGFIGRYIYTAVPRSVDGAAVEAAELEREIARLEGVIEEWIGGDPARERLLRPVLQAEKRPQGGAMLVFGRGLDELRARLRWAQVRRRLPSESHARLEDLAQTLRRRRVLHRQTASLAAARQLLGLWHTIHVPIGVALFTTAVIHIAAAIYYATLLR